MPVKSVRFDRLLASTALGLVLMLSSQAGQAQQSDKPVQASVPMPDTSLPPPLTAKDVGSAPAQAAPAAEPAKEAVTTPAAATTDVSDKLREMIGGKLDRIVSHKADREAVEIYYKSHNYA